MASMLTCIATSAAWCCCTATASLLTSCCGNDKPSTEAPGLTSGRKRSVLVLFLSIVLALAFQFGLAPFFVDSSLDNFVRDAWLDGCEKYVDDDALQKSCVANHGNYRVSAATTLFFTLAAAAATCKPTSNREAWPAKYVLYLFLVGVTVVIPANPIFATVYLNIARVGGVVFIIFQQLVILDLAHNWNESWVERSNKANAEESGSGKKWLVAILISCAILFGGAAGVMIYMFIEFTGCPTNNAFIALTLIFCIALTTAQLSGDEGSLLSSACISAWAVFLCYTAVTNNPDSSCNPRLGEVSPLSIAFGLTVTLISLCWTGWSYTAEDKLRVPSGEQETAAAEETTPEEGNGGGRVVSGVVTGDAHYGAMGDGSRDKEDDATEKADPERLSNSWRLNTALAAVACWKAMVLTHWGEIQADGTIANPSVGRVSMWMIIASQWLVMTLYVWTLLAPRLFPNRDFS